MEPLPTYIWVTAPILRSSVFECQGRLTPYDTLMQISFFLFRTFSLFNGYTNYGYSLDSKTYHCAHHDNDRQKYK